MLTIQEYALPLAPERQEEIALLYREVFNQVYPDLAKDLPRCRDSVAYWLRKEPSLFLVFRAEELAGFMILDGNFLDELYLRRDLQGQGIGSALIALAKGRSPELKLFTMKQNERAIAFYQQHGFQVVREGIAADEQVPDVEMHWTKRTEAP